MTFALRLEYINYVGDTVVQYLPVFRSMDECGWWQEFLTNMVTGKATVISAVCKAVGA